MLWRALQHVEKGFYIDIGAQHPVLDSVSKGFYGQGWRGIHVEPVHVWAELLRQDRPDETVLEAAISDINGTLTLNVIADSGLSTVVDQYARRHHAEGGWKLERVQVPCLTLDAAMAALVGDREVHWLKIDVEGAEQAVLKGWNPQHLQPWIIVVEATEPNSQTPSYSNWESFLLDAGYHFVYFDGLNRFYIAAKHPELEKAFDRPPNVFDQAQLSATSRWCNHAVGQLTHTEHERDAALVKAGAAEALARQAERQTLAAEACTMQCLGERDEALAQADRLRGELQGLYASKSWRVTGPARRVVRLLKSSLRSLVLIVMRWTLRHARIKAVFRRLLGPFPQVIRRLRALALHRDLLEPAHSSFGVPDPRSTPMSPRAAEIYARLLRIRASNTFRGHD